MRGAAPGCSGRGPSAAHRDGRRGQLHGTSRLGSPPRGGCGTVGRCPCCALDNGTRTPAPRAAPWHAGRYLAAFAPRWIDSRAPPLREVTDLLGVSAPCPSRPPRPPLSPLNLIEVLFLPVALRALRVHATRGPRSRELVLFLKKEGGREGQHLKTPLALSKMAPRRPSTGGGRKEGRKGGHGPANGSGASRP